MTVSSVALITVTTKLLASAHAPEKRLPMGEIWGGYRGDIGEI